MKKLLALVITVAMVMTALPCFGAEADKSAYELYNEANAALADVDSVLFKTDIVMGMSIDVGGEAMNLDVAMNGTVTEVIRSATDMDMMMELYTSMMDMDIDVTGYYLDGILYMDSMGTRYKMEMPIGEALKQMSASPVSFGESAVKDQAIEDVQGGVEVSFVLDGKELSDIVTGQLGAMNDLMNLDESVEMTMSDIMLTAVIGKNNALKYVTMDYAIEMSVAGQEMSIDCEMYLEVVKIGGLLINFPDDLDDYEFLAE